MNKIKKTFRKAFTLVELIIVIAVIAILAIFLIPNFSNVLSDANATNVKSDTANIKNIVMAYISETGAVPVANTDTKKENVIKVPVPGKTNEFYFPGTSVGMFQSTAQDNKFYVIDMDLLTKAQINIEDKVSTTSPKLSSTPGTSAIVNVQSSADGDKTNAKNPGVGIVETNKKVKNTSVVYVIDKNLNVYAAYSKDIKSKETPVTTFDASTIFEVLADDVPGAKDTDYAQNATFKTNAAKVPAKTILTSIQVDDSNYN